MTLPRRAVRQGADQPDARHPPALDAVGRALHPLRGRGQRTGLPAQGGRAGDHLTSSATRSTAPMKPMPNHPPELAPAPGLRRASRRHRVRLRRRRRARRPAPGGRRTWSSARGASPRRTARPRSGRARPRRPPPSSARRVEFVELDGDAHLEVKRRPCDPAGGRDPAVAAGDRPGAQPRREPAPRPFPARPPRARRGPARPLRRRREAARRRPAFDRAICSFTRSRPEAEPRDVTPILIDISAPEVLAAWTAAMEAHASQLQARQLRRAAAGASARARAAGRRRPRACPLSQRPARLRIAGAARPQREPLLTWIPAAPSEDRHHLLSVGRRQRHPRLGPGRGAGAPRATRCISSATSARFGCPADRPAAPLPSGRDQRLRPVQVPRLHAAALGEDGGSQPRPSAGRPPRPLRGPACHGGDPGAVDAAARSCARRSSRRCTAPTPRCSAAIPATGRPSATR